MLAATEGHAKNFSLQIQPAGKYRLTPLYDVLSIWPVEGPGAHQMDIHKVKLAMAVWGKNRHHHINGIQRRHFNHMAPRCGLGKDAEVIIERLIAQTPRVLATINAELPKGFPAQVAEPILGQLERAAQRLAAMPAYWV